MLKLAIVLAATLVSTAALAADPTFPDMLGTWKVDGTAIVVGAGGHHPADAEPRPEGTKPRLRPFEATLRIDGQEGDRFWGTLATSAQIEDFIGAFTGEGGRFVAVDSDGFHSGEVLTPGSARDCYQHVAPTLHIAACQTWTRE